MKPVTVMLPEWLWGRLASIADRSGMTVGDVIATALLNSVEPDRPLSRLQTLNAELSAARKSGWRAPRRG